MADRRTRYAKGLKDVTLYGTTTVDSAGTFQQDGTTNSVLGVASGDTSYDGVKVSYGQCVITGSRDVQTGLTTVFAGGANINNPKGREGHLTGFVCNCRIPRDTGGPVSLSKGAGYMKVRVMSTASLEADQAASIDWFAIGQ